MDCSKYLFTKVRCGGYLKKVHDGKFINTRYEDDEVDFCDSNLDKSYKGSDFPDYDADPIKRIVIRTVPAGDGDRLRKRYYRIVEKEFTGIVVGFKDIALSADLASQVFEDDCGKDTYYISREYRDIEKCAIVYFANNRKRYVPASMMDGIEKVVE